MYPIMNYLIENPLIAIFLCLGLGYILGNLKIKSFSFGATAATLLTAIVVSLLARKYGCVEKTIDANLFSLLIAEKNLDGITFLGNNKVLISRFLIDKNLQNCFYAMFTFTLGYDVGPAFFKALRSSGIRIVVLAVVHAVCAGVFIWLACVILGFGADVGVGLLAGAFTSTAAAGASQGGATSLVYSLTYSIGTICAISFVRFLAPKLLGIDLLKETKLHLDSMEHIPEETDSDDCGILQVRALQILPGSFCAGKTVDQIEASYDFHMEIETIARGSSRIPGRQSELLHAGDVLTVIGDISALSRLDDQGLEEVADPQYFQVQQCSAQIVLTNGMDAVIRERLTNYSILVQDVTRNGKHLQYTPETDLCEGDVLEVYGPKMAIEEVAKSLGYLKDNGITTDIPFFSLAIAAGLVVAAVSFLIMGRSISLGTSFGTLIVGLLCGWWYDRTPRFGHIADSTRWFIKSIGLNLYIAVAGLLSSMTLQDLLSPRSLLYIVVGAALTMIVRTVVLLIGKYILKLGNVDLLGGICGSATSTPALNALTEHTGSSVYALSYAPGYAVGNVLLILTGIVLANIIP